MQFRLSYQLLLTLPFMVAGIVYGLRRGWREEALTSVALLVALILFGERLADNMGDLVNRLVQTFALFFGGDIASQQLVTEENKPYFRAAGFAISVFLAYFVGGVLGSRRSVGRGGKLLGAILGAVNVFLIASQVFTYTNRFLPLAFQHGEQITLTPDSNASILRGYLPSIFALLLILLLIVVFLRLPKIRE